MKTALALFCGTMFLLMLGSKLSSSAETVTTKPAYAGSKLIRPEGYREWIYISSGLGMEYNPTAGAPEAFTTAFVPQWAYHSFLTSGKWPDKTIFALEVRASETKGSINKSGHFQTDLARLSVEVKDETRFPEKWAYFVFPKDVQTVEAMPKEQCWNCHEANAAVEHSFVQFYPTLKPIAQKFRTYRKALEDVPQQH